MVLLPQKGFQSCVYGYFLAFSCHKILQILMNSMLESRKHNNIFHVFIWIHNYFYPKRYGLLNISIQIAVLYKTQETCQVIFILQTFGQKLFIFGWNISQEIIQGLFFTPVKSNLFQARTYIYFKKRQLVSFFLLTPDHFGKCTLKWFKNNVYFWFSTAFKISKHVVPPENTYNNPVCL